MTTFIDKHGRKRRRPIRPSMTTVSVCCLFLVATLYAARVYPTGRRRKHASRRSSISSTVLSSLYGLTAPFTTGATVKADQKHWLHSRQIDSQSLPSRQRRLDNAENNSNNENEANDNEQEEQQAENNAGELEQDENGSENQDQGNSGNNENDQKEEKGGSRDRGPHFGDDDFFVDSLQDDLVTNYDDKDYIDDFYAFARDPGPPQLFPLSPKYIIGFVTAFFALTLGATSGTGGGGVIVPVYIIVMGLPLKVAVPIGAVTVLGSSSANTIINSTRRHPLADRPLIDWDLVMVMEPFTLVGMLVGTLFHQLFSEKLLLVLLVLLLTTTAHMTLSKAMRMYQAEKRYIRHLNAQSEQHGESPLSFAKTNTWQEVDTNVNGPRPSSGRRMNDEEKQQILIVNPDFVTIRSDLLEQEKFTPRGKIIAVILNFSVVVFLNIMVGGGAYQSPWNIRCGSAAFWIVHGIMIAYLLCAAWVAQTYVVARHEVKELVRFDYVHGDIKWDSRSAILYPAVFVMAGFFAGTLGIGGGVITVPIMLTMGVHPAVVAATSSAMIMFTSLGTTSSFLIFGLILKDFAIFAFCIGFTASLTGQFLMKRARQARSASGRVFERNSFLAFAIGGVVLLSSLLLTVQYVFKILQRPDNEYDDGKLCEGLRF